METGPACFPTSPDPRDASNFRAGGARSFQKRSGRPDAGAGKEPGRENVEVVSADLLALPERSQSLDVVWLHLFYHDLHTALLQTKGATPPGFNRAVYERLKPGGFYVIVDHVAPVIESGAEGDSELP